MDWVVVLVAVVVIYVVIDRVVLPWRRMRQAEERWQKWHRDHPPRSRVKLDGKRLELYLDISAYPDLTIVELAQRTGKRGMWRRYNELEREGWIYQSGHRNDKSLWRVKR